MSITLDLTPEEEARLKAQADRRGESADALARQLFRRGLDLEDTPTDKAAPGQTLAESLKDFIGIVDSRTMTPPASEKSAAFTDILAEKARKQGLNL